MERAVAVQPGEDALFVNDQKMAWRLLLRQERQHLRFRDADRGVSFPRRWSGFAAQAALALPQVNPDEERATSVARRSTTWLSWRRNSSRRRGITAGAKARGYLADRGPTRRRSSVSFGYAPAERFALKEHLGKEGIPTEDMVEAGLLVAGEDIPVPYDRFRDRVMF